MSINSRIISYGMDSCICDPDKSLHPCFTARFQKGSVLTIDNGGWLW